MSGLPDLTCSCTCSTVCRRVSDQYYVDISTGKPRSVHVRNDRIEQSAVLRSGRGRADQLTRDLAYHLAPERIRVNAIRLGPFPQSASRATHPDIVTELQPKVPLARIGDPAELAGRPLSLASDAASYATGASRAVDGSWTAW